MGFDFSRLSERQLHTSRLRLQPPQPQLAAGICAYFVRNRAFLTPWSPRVRPVFYTEIFQQQKIQQELRQMADKQLVKFWLFAQEDADLQRPLGHVSYSNLVWGAFRSCFLGYSLDQQATGRGYATEALRESLRFVFEELRLHRVEANIMPSNRASIQVVKKLGFACEGQSPKYLKINGQWEDHLHYVMRNQALE